MFLDGRMNLEGFLRSQCEEEREKEQGRGEREKEGKEEEGKKESVLPKGTARAKTLSGF